VQSALEECVARSELFEPFLEDPIAADERTQCPGFGYDAPEVRA